MIKRMFPFLFIFISSCAFMPEYEWEGVEEVTTIQEALDYMSENITYDIKYINKIRMPEETNNVKRGDCKGMSSLLAHILIYNVNEADVKIVRCKRKTDGAGHVMVKIRSVYYEATRGTIYPNYDNVFYTYKELEYQDYINILRLYD